ncbi:MAG: cytochrome c oxidase subunit 3 [Chloroflexota bacterium]
MLVSQYDTLNDYFRIMLGNSASDFGMRFYAPTAFHGAHVIIGVIWALLILWRGYRGFYDENAIGVEMFGLYWHFVDVVWIVLFTLIYLV